MAQASAQAAAAPHTVNAPEVVTGTPAALTEANNAAAGASMCAPVATHGPPEGVVAGMPAVPYPPVAIGVVPHDPSTLPAQAARLLALPDVMGRNLHAGKFAGASLRLRTLSYSK